MSDPEREPCPYRIFEDMGSAFLLGKLGYCVTSATDRVFHVQLRGIMLTIDPAGLHTHTSISLPWCISNLRRSRGWRHLALLQGVPQRAQARATGGCADSKPHEGAHSGRQLWRVGRPVQRVRLLPGALPRGGGPLERHHVGWPDGRPAGSARGCVAGPTSPLL